MPSTEADRGRVPQLDRYGWDLYGDERFACSLLAGKGDQLNLYFQTLGAVIEGGWK